VDLRAGLGRSGEEKNPLALPIIQHATYSLYRMSYLGSFHLPNSVKLLEEYKLQSPSLEFSKHSCSFLPISYTETFLAAPRCQTLLYKTDAESEAEYLKQRLYINTVMVLYQKISSQYHVVRPTCFYFDAETLH
jgi:hypothetical protein